MMYLTCLGERDDAGVAPSFIDKGAVVVGEVV